MGCCCCCSSKKAPVAEPSRTFIAQSARIESPVPEYQRQYNSPAYREPVFDDEEEEPFLGLICEIQLPAERNACNITDSVELADGSLVLCDQRNGKLMLFDEDFKFVTDLALGGLPYKITDIPWRRNTMAVSILTGNKIQYVKVNNGILQSEDTALPSTSRGLDCSEGMLIYIMDTFINMRDVENNAVQMEHDLEKPVSILVDRKHELIYILCETSECFTRLVMAKLSDNTREFDKQYADIKAPVSMCRDQRGFIYICGRDPPSIYKLSPRGENLGNVYKAKFGLLQHLQYSSANDVFMLTKPNTNKIWLYRFE